MNKTKKTIDGYPKETYRLWGSLYTLAGVGIIVFERNPFPGFITGFIGVGMLFLVHLDSVLENFFERLSPPNDD